MEGKIEGKKEEKKNRGKSWRVPNLGTLASEYVKMEFLALGNSNAVLEKHQKWLKSHIIWNMNLSYKTLAGILNISCYKIAKQTGLCHRKQVFLVLKSLEL